MSHTPTKICCVCAESKPVDGFSRDSRRKDGLRSQCKVCVIKYNKSHNNWKMPGKNTLATRRYRENHIETVRARDREAWRNGTKKQTRRDPLKEAARVLLRNSVSAGKVIKPKNCVKCGISAILHGHHSDYQKPLDVLWLCSICHGREHRKALALADKEKP